MPDEHRTTQARSAGVTVPATDRKAKSEAGTDRRPPIAQTLRPIRWAEWLGHGRPATGEVSAVSVMSGRPSDRALRAWGWKRDNAGKLVKARADALAPITLHECRHTYASFLMAAGYTLRELMEYMGHSNLAMVQRYVKLRPSPKVTDPAGRLHAYLARRAG